LSGNVLSAIVDGMVDWQEREINRLRERIELIEQERREEKQRATERWSRVMFGILWIEIAAIWAFSIAKAAGAW
jgi:hypothetical protein